MSKAAEMVFAAIRNEGSQESVLSTMQTRDELYKVLNYHAYEQLLDQLYPKQV
jgi:methylisocitrate lyase